MTSGGLARPWMIPMRLVISIGVLLAFAPCARPQSKTVPPSAAAVSPAEDFAKVVAPGVTTEKITGGFGAIDGVAYSRLAYLVVSDFARDAIVKVTSTTICGSDHPSCSK